MHSEQRRPFFCGQEFSGCDHSEPKAVFCGQDQGGSFCGQEFLGLWPLRTKTGRYVVRNFSGWDVVVAFSLNWRHKPSCVTEQTRVFCGQGFLGSTFDFSDVAVARETEHNSR